jgi:hypothetical protein
MEGEGGIMELATKYADTMMRSAISYCNARHLRIEPEHLSQCLRAHKETITGALADAKEALDAHMDKIAEATFLASAAQAGIAAAKMYELERS